MPSVCLVGLYHSGVKMPGSGSIDLRVAEQIHYPHIFESFAFVNDRMMRAIRQDRQRIFLDSGAFTAHHRNTVISMVRYADFISEHRDIIEVAANLDVIEPGNEQRSYDRLKRLQELLAFHGLAHLVKPVHHVLDRDYWLERYLAEGHDFICLGGMVARSLPTRLVRTWLDRIFNKFLTNADGTAKVQVHGFGLSNLDLLNQYPWHSADSSTWFQVSRKAGAVLMDIPRADGSIEEVKIDFTERRLHSPMHYRRLHPDDRRLVDQRLEQLEAERIRDPELEADFKAEFGALMGFNPVALGLSYGLRDLGNIGYYQRLMDRVTALDAGGSASLSD